MVGYAAAHAVEVVQPVHIVNAVEVVHRTGEVVHILAVAEVHIKAVPRSDKRREVEAGKQVVPVALGGFAAVFLGSALLVVKHVLVANGVFHLAALGWRLVVDVPAIVHHRRESVSLAEAVHEFGGNVVVFHIGIWLHGVGVVVELLKYGPGQLAEIRHASRHVKRGVPLPYRALGLDAARQYAHTQQAVVAVEVAVLNADVDHARQPRAIPGRKRAAIEVDVLHHIGVDGAHKSAHVLGIVDGRAVDGDVVLVVVAAAHKQARSAVAARLHPGKTLYGLQHIGLAEKHWHRHYLLLAKRHGAHLRRSHAEIAAAAIHHHIIKSHATDQTAAVGSGRSRIGSSHMSLAQHKQY